MSNMGIDRFEELLPRTPELIAPGTDDGAGKTSFSKIIGEVLSDANKDVVHAESQARALSEGKADAVETVLALNRADMSLKFVVQLRNRFIEAYREITRLNR